MSILSIGLLAVLLRRGREGASYLTRRWNGESAVRNHIIPTLRFIGPVLLSIVLSNGTSMLVLPDERTIFHPLTGHILHK